MQITLITVQKKLEMQEWKLEMQNYSLKKKKLAVPQSHILT